MTVTPVTTSTPVDHTQNTPSNKQSAENVTKNQTATPQDSVTVSSAARAQQTRPAGDVDHDGDSK
jgi:anti-sigma28 factor (negative regulator of flagellin synthesis)